MFVEVKKEIQLEIAHVIAFSCIVMASCANGQTTPVEGKHKHSPTGKTINAASANLADVNAAIKLALDGDTVIVPAGTATWNSTLTIRKPIHLKGMTTVNSLSGTTNDKTIT